MIAVLDDDPTGRRRSRTPPSCSTGRRMCCSACPRGRSTSSPIRARSRPPTPTPSPARSRPRCCGRFPGAQLVLRGDSTLRAHLREEYDAVRDVAFPGLTPTLLLVPALPAAGRVTVGGVHLLERSGRRVPLHETEYATDGVFAYRSSRLLDWADERSHGLFPCGVRQRGAARRIASRRRRSCVLRARGVSRTGGPAVCAPDAETSADLAAIAERTTCRAGRRSSRRRPLRPARSQGVLGRHARRDAPADAARAVPAYRLRLVCAADDAPARPPARRTPRHARRARALAAARRSAGQTNSRGPHRLRAHASAESASPSWPRPARAPPQPTTRRPPA